MRVSFFILLVLLVACGDTLGDHNISSTALVKFVKIEDDPTNILRKWLEVELLEPCTMKVEWARDGVEERSLTRVIDRMSVDHKIHLVLMSPESKYTVNVEVVSGTGVTQTLNRSFNTGPLPLNMIQLTNTIPESKYAFDGYIHIGDKNQGGLYLINSNGEIVWYQSTFDKNVICSNFDPHRNAFISILGFNPNQNFTGEYIYAVDLFGNEIVNWHYTEMDNPLFHHDVSFLGEDKILILNQVVGRFDLSICGGSTDEQVVGDGFTIVDMDGVIKYSWSIFDELSPHDDPNIMGDKGEFQYPVKDDWVHANSVAYTDDGCFLLSFNRNSQIWKIDPQNKTVVYKLGAGGDVSIDNKSNFTDRQHSVHINHLGSVMAFDNGCNAKKSRAISYSIDPLTNHALVDWCVDLPDFSVNQSSAEMVDNRTILYGATVPRIIGIVDLFGAAKWRYKVNNPFYRAIYINRIKL